MHWHHPHNPCRYQIAAAIFDIYHTLSFCVKSGKEKGYELKKQK